jgi:glycosyltransferase involved in cell wall biosynthesis
MFGWFGRKPATLSVCIVAQDQVGLLPRLLRNVEAVADEIVVVDGGSKDDTREVARAHPKVRLLERPFDTVTLQKNFAIQSCARDWVLVLDSDELLGDRLRERIPTLIRHWRHRWYKLPRYWLVETAPPRYVRSERLYPDWQLRLFRRDPVFRYLDDRPVHHRFPKQGRGPGTRVAGAHIVHLDFLLNDRAARERKVARYDALDPERADVNAMYLYEDAPHEVLPCEERISSLDGA